MVAASTLASALGAVLARALPPITEKGALLEWLAWGSGTGLVVLAVYATCLADVWATDDRSVRRFQKRVWLVLAAIPLLGAVAWLLLGRPRRKASARGSAVGRPGARQPRSSRGGTPRLTVVPPANPSEELNAQIARSEELNRRLEAWEAEQRAQGSPPSEPRGFGDVRHRPSETPAVPHGPGPDSADKSDSPTDAQVRPDPKLGDLSAWDADLRRWEEELRQPDPDDQ